MQTCQIEGCGKPVFVKARGWCRTHYHRWYRHGDPLFVKHARIDGTAMDRWLARVDKDGPSGCWLWIGSKDRRGYGQFDDTVDGVHKNWRAYRWGYVNLVGPIEDGLELDHLCRVHACVNPAHLEPVTHAENVARGLSGAHNAVKTHCAQGHPFDDTNTRVDARGWRICRQCIHEDYLNRRDPNTGPANGNKTHCKNGHEFTPENTHYPKRGGRVCKECRRKAVRESMRRRRAAERARQLE